MKKVIIASWLKKKEEKWEKVRVWWEKVWETGRSSGARNGKWELKQTQVFAHLLYFQTFVILSDKIYRKSRRVDFNQKVHSELQRRRILQNGLGI